MNNRLLKLCGVCLVLISFLGVSSADPFDTSELEDILIMNAYDGDVGKVKELLGKGVNINAQGENGETPLLAAVNSGKSDVVALLLAYGANIEEKNFQKSTPLIIACQYGHAHITAMLVEMGADINARDYNGYDPLMIAAARGHDLIVRQLLAFGADPAHTNKHGNNALILAMYDMHLPVVKTLLEKGGKKQLLQRNNRGQTPLDFARALNNPKLIDLVESAYKKAGLLRR